MVVDPLDAEAVREAVVRAEPDVVVHQLTALAELGMTRNFDKSFAVTNRLRTEGTDYLIAAARAAGARRLVWQSFAGWPYARSGAQVKTEDDPLDPEPPADARETLAAIRHLERAVLESGLEGFVLRYGGVYGPTTSIDTDGDHAELVRKRRFPIGGDGTGMWSFIHIDDAAAATVAAIEGGTPGIYNVVDDDPAPTSEWLPRSRASSRPRPRLPLSSARRPADVLADTRQRARPRTSRSSPSTLRELSASTAGSPRHQSPSTRNAGQNARLADSSSSELVDVGHVERLDRRRQVLDLRRRPGATSRASGSCELVEHVERVRAHHHDDLRLHDRDLLDQPRDALRRGERRCRRPGTSRTASRRRRADRCRAA